MAGRGQIPPTFEGRSMKAPGMMRHGAFPGLGGSPGHRPLEPLPPPRVVENKIVVQEAEIEQLAGDNHRLAATHVALRQELAAAQQEIQTLRHHIRSIQTESDIQVRVLLDKIAKMEVDIRAGESVKKEMQQARMEAHGLVTSRQELTAQIQQATQKLENARADIKKLPEMHAELDGLRQEHQRLRAAFVYEKGLNIEQVEQMRVMEKNLVGMAREVEKLRAEVLKTEKRVRAPNYGGGAYVSPDPSFPTVQGSAAYVDEFGRPYSVPSVEGNINLYGTGNGSVSTGGAAVTGGGNGGARGGTYDPSLAPR